MHRSPAWQVQMKMKDRLSRFAIRVEYRPIAAGRDAAFFRDRGGPSNELADEPVVFLADVVQRFDVTFRDDEHVRGRLRADVVEGEHAVVLVHDARGNLPLDDFA